MNLYFYLIDESQNEFVYALSVVVHLVVIVRGQSSRKEF